MINGLRGGEDCMVTFTQEEKDFLDELMAQDEEEEESDD
jgi:hypothetical protein